MAFPPDIDWGALATGVGGFGVLRLIEASAKIATGRLRDKEEATDKREERDARERVAQAAREAAEKVAQDTVEASVRDEMRAQITVLYTRVDTLTERLDHANERHNALVSEIALLKAENHRIIAENHLIRAENHQMRNYMTTLIATAQRYHKLLNFPPEDMPRIPSWLEYPEWKERAAPPSTPAAEEAPAS